jgi:NADH-quinone oxidoreductase subunit E
MKTAKPKREIAAIVVSYPPERRYSLAILQDIQREHGHIPEEALTVVKGHVGTTEAQLFALVTFYKALSLTPKGRHVVKLCDGTACHMRGASNLADAVRHHLSISADGRTKDGQFSLELVNCLGSCALAPVVVVDEAYYGKVTMEGLPGTLDRYQEGGDLDE